MVIFSQLFWHSGQIGTLDSALWPIFQWRCKFGALDWMLGPSELPPLTKNQKSFFVDLKPRFSLLSRWVHNFLIEGISSFKHLIQRIYKVGGWQRCTNGVNNKNFKVNFKNISNLLSFLLPISWVHALIASPWACQRTWNQPKGKR